MAYILHIDTATDQGLYFLAKDGHILQQADSGHNRDHAATLPGIIAGILEQAGLSFQNIDAFAVNGGPGSYTGLRIGLAAAKGYCFSLQKPLLVANRLLLLLESLGEEVSNKNLLAVLPARSGEYFAAGMNKERQITLPPQHLFTAQLQSWMSGLKDGLGAIGLATPEIAAALPDIQQPFYQPETWAGLAYERFKAGAFDDLAATEPYYLKAAFTTQARKSKV